MPLSLTTEALTGGQVAGDRTAATCPIRLLQDRER
jgi:hypothetical protein